MNKEKIKLKLSMLTLPPELIIIVCIIVSALLLVTGLLVPAAHWLKTFIFVCCVILTGYDIVFDTVMKVLREHEFNGNLLIVAAAAGAFAIGRGAEGAAVMIIFRAGEILHSKTVKRSANLIESLMDLRPESVNAVINGAIVQMAPGKISVGDIISVSPGERIALDGVIISGDSELDTSAMHGEVAPIPVTEGSAVLSGSVNLTGVLNIRVSTDFDHSTVSRVLKLVEEAEARKANPEIKFRSFARLFTPAVAGVAVILGIIIPLLGGLPLSPWLSRALGLLVISSPAASVISVALTYFAGIGSATKNGIIFKGADIVDTVAHTTSVVFEKTGTLTDGIYQVVSINARGIPEQRLLMLAAYAELFSNHPVACAIVASANILPDFTKVSDSREFAGRGAEVEIGGNTVTVGSALLMEELGVMPDISKAEASVAYIAINGKYAGRILLNDTVRTESKKAVKDMHAIGIDRIVIFTGDKKEAAADVAGQLGIKEYYAECLAEDKLTRLKGLMEMQLPGDKLLFAGNGIDDAPIMKMADVGITLGGLGSGKEHAAADMIIMTENPSKIAAAITIARRTNKIVGQNVLLSLGLKGLILILVMLGVASIWMAVLADVVFALILIFNAMRALGLSRDDIRKTLPRQKSKIEDDSDE